jgi:hypothetical protein
MLLTAGGPRHRADRSSDNARCAADRIRCVAALATPHRFCWSWEPTRADWPEHFITVLAARQPPTQLVTIPGMGHVLSAPVMAPLAGAILAHPAAFDEN